MQRKQQDFLRVPANSANENWVIADVHGMIDELRIALAHAKPGDGFFIGGDLGDRGTDSEAVIDLILEAQANPQKFPKIYIAFGNHEEAALKSIASLEQLYQAIHLKFRAESVIKVMCNNIPRRTMYHHQLGGEWLTNLFLREIKNSLITIQNDRVSYADNSKVKAIKNLFSSLPHFIELEGEDGFRIVHGDISCNEKELRQRLQSGVGFFDTEKHYANHARVLGIDEHLMIYDDNKIGTEKLTYCGHDVIFQRESAIRSRSNSVNLDFGCFLSKTLLLVNDTQKKVFACSVVPNLEYSRELFKFCAEITEHLHAQPMLRFLKKITDQLTQHTFKLNWGGKNVSKLGYFSGSGALIMEKIRSVLQRGTLSFDNYKQLLDYIQNELTHKTVTTPSISLFGIGEFAGRDQTTVDLYMQILNDVRNELARIESRSAYKQTI